MLEKIPKISKKRGKKSQLSKKGQKCFKNGKKTPKI